MTIPVEIISVVLGALLGAIGWFLKGIISRLGVIDEKLSKITTNAQRCRMERTEETNEQYIEVDRRVDAVVHEITHITELQRLILSKLNEQAEKIDALERRVLENIKA